MATDSDSKHPLAQEPERELMARAARDEVAFAELFRRHAPAIGRYVLRRSGDARLAEDVVAETFLAAWTGWSRFRWRGISCRHWLYRVSHRIQRRLNGRRQPICFTDAATQHVRDSKESAFSGPSSLGEDRRDLDRVRHALTRLPAKQRDVVALFYLEELGIDDIARIVGCRPGTVKSRLSRGRDRLREFMLSAEDRRTTKAEMPPRTNASVTASGGCERETSP